MNDASGEMQDTTLIFDTADRLLREQCSKELVDRAEAGEWPEGLWRTLMDTGLPWAAAPERLGGAALPLADALGLLRLVGTHAAPVPLAETMIATALLGEAEGVGQLPEGPVALVVAAADEDISAQADQGGWVLDGAVAVAPFAPVAQALVLAWEDAGGLCLAAVPRTAAGITLEPDRSIAGDPRARVILTGVAVAETAVARPRTVASLERLEGVLALSRALMMAGAMQSLLDLSVGYAMERSQFGRPIAKFQAVQQQLSVLAGEAAATIRAADAGLEALLTDAAVREAGIAKARAGEAAGRGAAIAHQVHGAMGFTYEHRLHHRTRRLWAWRDEYGSEARWQARLGRELCQGGAEALWDAMTRPLS